MIGRMLLGGLLGTALLWGQPADAADPLKIGFAISKTGLFASGTGSQMNTYELWRDQVNAAGGLDVKGVKRPIEFDFYDDQSDPGKAVQIYEKLITSDKVDLLLPPWGTPAHIAVAGVLEKYKFPVVGDSAASVKLRELKAGNIFFTTGEMPDRFAKSIADCLKTNGLKTVAILSNQLPFSLEVKKYLVPALEADGLTLAVNEEYAPAVKDMTSLLTKVKNAGPQAVIVLSYPSDSALYMKQARELGVAAPFQLVLIGATDDWFGKQFGAGTNGIVTMGHWTPEQKAWPTGAAFAKAYVARFHEQPDYLDSALAYMACEILQQAVAKVGIDHDGLRHEYATATFQTVNGPVKFTGVENLSTPAGLLQIQGDKMELIWPPDVQTAKFMPKPAWPAK